MNRYTDEGMVRAARRERRRLRPARGRVLRVAHRWLSRVVIGLALAVPLAACGSSSLKWTEDVLLPDGRTVTLTRYQEFKGPSEPFTPPTESYYWFEFKNPDTGKKVRWENDRELVTIALGMEGGIPNLLTAPNFGGRFTYQCPDPPYLAFRYVDGKWVRVPLTELARKVITPNMTSLSVSKRRSIIEANHHHLSAADVAAHQSSIFRDKVIDLSTLKEQTFGTRCDPPFNWMLRNPGDVK